MAQIEGKKMNCKVNIDSVNGLVSLDCETIVSFNVKEHNLEYTINSVREIGFIETIKAESVREQINEIAGEHDKRAESIKRGLEELEKANIEIEVN